jgi:hypothetical protein
LTLNSKSPYFSLLAAKTILKEKNKVGGLTLSDVKTHYKLQLSRQEGYCPGDK